MESASIPISDVSGFNAKSAERLPFEISHIWSRTILTGLIIFILVYIEISNCIIITITSETIILFLT